MGVLCRKGGNQIDNNSELVEFGARIIQARKEKGLSQKELAELIGITAQAMYQYEKGKREPNVQTIFKLCDALEINGNWLLGLSEQKEKPAISDGELRELMKNPKAQEITAALYKMGDEEFERVYQMFRLLQHPPQ